MNPSTMHITPDCQTHADLERDVRSFLLGAGFLEDSATYHDVMSPQVVTRLGGMQTPGAVILRTRADRIAVHQEKSILFEWEAKTRISAAGAKRDLMFLEFLPLRTHLRRAQRDALDCLYCWRDPNLGLDRGFWASAPPRIQGIAIPRRFTDHPLGEFVRRVAQEEFPGVPLWDPASVRGSGDPFAILCEEMTPRLPEWRELILGRLRGGDTSGDTS